LSFFARPLAYFALRDFHTLAAALAAMRTRLNALHDTNPSTSKGLASINPTLCPKFSVGKLASAQYFDEKGFCPHFTHLNQDSNLCFTADARATSSSGSFPTEISAASFLGSEEFDLHDMRVPTNLPKDAPQFDKGKKIV
jgi:hypothetical protein